MGQTNVNIQQKRKMIDDREGKSYFMPKRVLNLPCERNTAKLKKKTYMSRL